MPAKTYRLRGKIAPSLLPALPPLQTALRNQTDWTNGPAKGSAPLLFPRDPHHSRRYNVQFHICSCLFANSLCANPEWALARSKPHTAGEQAHSPQDEPVARPSAVQCIRWVVLRDRLSQPDSPPGHAIISAKRLEPGIPKSSGY